MLYRRGRKKPVITSPIVLENVVYPPRIGVWSVVGALREAPGDCVPHVVDAVWRVDVCGN